VWTADSAAAWTEAIDDAMRLIESESDCTFDSELPRKDMLSTGK
jgi:hypothetical protein